MIGQAISHYKILEKLGEGGMGVVYKAHDTTLDRYVALKFLPGEYSSSEEEQARFLHEAKAASALDHPNICTIYEVGTSPDGRVFIAMGYYEGTVLSRKIERGRLDAAEAIGIAIQIAEGLQAAHEKGIVHRDIKSSNIIVSDKGQLRILDFGLARKKGLSRLTRTGTTVGTASYMSPEQARGEFVDQRTDIWSLGVVLYEMVTGRLPFRGEHEVAILYSVVNEEPQSIQASANDTSPELHYIIRRALEKDPADRYQSASDMLIELRRLKKETSKTGFEPVGGSRKRIHLFRRKGLVATLVIVILAIGGYFLFMRKGVEMNPDYSLRWMNVPLNTIGMGPAITPDAKWVVFGAEDEKKRWDLYVASVTGGEPRRVTQDSSDEVSSADISPDGTRIVYNQVSSKTYSICTVSFNGGISKKIGIGNQPSWSPDGKRIGYVLDPTELGPDPYQPSERATSKSGNGEFWTMNPDGSGNTLEFVDTVAARSYSHIYFAWSPDGRSVAWSHRALRNGQENNEIIIHDLDSHDERAVVSKGISITKTCWTANNQIIYSVRMGEERNLWMVPAGGGSPVRITKGLANTGSPNLSVDGRTLIFLMYKNIGHLWLAKTDGSGEREEVKVAGEPFFICPSISPDGKYITVVIPSLGGTTVFQVFILKRDGTDMHQISTGDNYHWWPTWSPDGTKIFYYARGYYDQYKSFSVYVANVPKFDAPRLVTSGDWASWADSGSIQLRRQNKMWRVFVDGRPPQAFSKDSIWAWTVGGRKYVIFQDQHQRALLAGGTTYQCKFDEWDGIGPKNAVAIPKGDWLINLDQLYLLKESDIYRVSFPDWKIAKLNVNTQEMSESAVSTTRDGKEFIYSSKETVNKIGVIENLFR
jgi:serine/threonine protein kinase